MQTWEKVWRELLAPEFTSATLRRLAEGLEARSFAIVTRLFRYTDMSGRVFAGCAVGYAVLCEGLEDERLHAARCWGIVSRAVGYAPFFNWFDNLPKAVTFPALAAVCRSIIRERGDA